MNIKTTFQIKCLGRKYLYEVVAPRGKFDQAWGSGIISRLTLKEAHHVWTRRLESLEDEILIRACEDVLVDQLELCDCADCENDEHHRCANDCGDCYGCERAVEDRRDVEHEINRAQGRR